jgi:uncharacterized protein
MFTDFQLNVSQLLKEPIGSVRSYDFVDTEAHLPDGFRHQLTGAVQLLRTDRGLLAEVTADTDINIACSRCLSELKTPIKLNFQEEFLPSLDMVTRLPLTVPPSAFAIDEHHILDLGEALNQYALLAIPMKPLCSPSCKGLCPNCGKNLNLGPCQCTASAADSRWDALRSAMPEMNR